MISSFNLLFLQQRVIVAGLLELTASSDSLVGTVILGLGQEQALQSEEVVNLCENRFCHSIASVIRFFSSENLPNQAVAFSTFVLETPDVLIHGHSQVGHHS